MKNMLKEPLQEWNAEKYHQHDRPLDQEAAKYLLIKMKQVLDAHNITFMPCFGTLLGAIREHGFIKNDDDVDTVIFAEDIPKIFDLRPELEKYDIHLDCYVLPWIITFEYKGITCDLYPLHQSAWPWTNWYYLVLEQYVNRKYFDNTEKYELFGEQFTIPASPEQFLAYVYGDDWRIPKSTKGKVESRLFFWRYAHRYLQKWERRFKRHILKRKE